MYSYDANQLGNKNIKLNIFQVASTRHMIF